MRILQFPFDRCEAFSTYPRTYDLLHLDSLFSAESQRYGTGPNVFITVKSVVSV